MRPCRIGTSSGTRDCACASRSATGSRASSSPGSPCEDRGTAARAARPSAARSAGVTRTVAAGARAGAVSAGRALSCPAVVVTVRRLSRPGGRVGFARSSSSPVDVGGQLRCQACALVRWPPPPGGMTRAVRAGTSPLTEGLLVVPLQQPELAPPLDRLGAGARLQLAIGRRDLGLDGVPGDAELLRDLTE